MLFERVLSNALQSCESCGPFAACADRKQHNSYSRQSNAKEDAEQSSRQESCAKRGFSWANVRRVSETYSSHRSAVKGNC